MTESWWAGCWHMDADWDHSIPMERHMQRKNRRRRHRGYHAGHYGRAYSQIIKRFERRYYPMQWRWERD